MAVNFKCTVVAALLAAFLPCAAARAAELPSQSVPAKKPKQAEPAARTCNIAGISGVMLANGVCVKFSGFVSTEFSAGQVK